MSYFLGDYYHCWGNPWWKAGIEHKTETPQKAFCIHELACRSIYDFECAPYKGDNIISRENQKIVSLRMVIGYFSFQGR